MAWGRLLDIVYFLYFATHIPITILVDSQSIFPKEHFPPWAVQLLEGYCKEMKDSMMMDPPIWFQSFCICEVLFQLPFFFPAAYAFLSGYKNNLWIRIPCLVYAAHVATTLVPIMSHVLLHDFTDSKFPGPETLKERLSLMAIYSPYFVIPFSMLLRFTLGSEHVHDLKKKAA